MVINLKSGFMSKKLPVYGILLSDKEIRLNSMNRMSCKLFRRKQK